MTLACGLALIQSACSTQASVVVPEVLVPTEVSINGAEEKIES